MLGIKATEDINLLIRSLVNQLLKHTCTYKILQVLLKAELLEKEKQQFKIILINLLKNEISLFEIRTREH